jgi:integrase
VHPVRHSFASLLLSAGVPILYVSQHLGHKDAVITLRTYANWMPTSDTRAHSALLDTSAVRDEKKRLRAEKRAARGTVAA